MRPAGTAQRERSSLRLTRSLPNAQAASSQYGTSALYQTPRAGAPFLNMAYAKPLFAIVLALYGIGSWYGRLALADPRFVFFFLVGLAVNAPLALWALIVDFVVMSHANTDGEGAYFYNMRLQLVFSVLILLVRGWGTGGGDGR